MSELAEQSISEELHTVINEAEENTLNSIDYEIFYDIFEENEK